MKKIPFLVGLFCGMFVFSKTAIAQTSDFKLSEYTLPNLNFQSLDARFHFTQDNSNIQEDKVFGDDRRNRSSSSGSLSLTYRNFINNLRWQRSTLARFNLRSILNSDTDRDGFGSNQFFMSNSNSLNTSNKLYKPSKNTFIGFDIRLGTRAIKNKRTYYVPNIPTTTDNTIDLDLSTSIGLKAGKGRIDQVTDARQAKLILEALEKEQKLQRNLDNDEFVEFAELISTIYRKRFFDLRIQKIYELEAIDSFLQNKNLITDTDIRYFTTLNDLWRFGGGPIRFSGQRFSVAIIPGYDFIQSGNSFSEYDKKLDMPSIHAGLEYTLEKPLNIYLQSGFDVYIYTGYIQGNFQNTLLGTDKQDLWLPKLNMGFEKRLSYYPNTRTTINHSIYLQYADLYDWFARDQFDVDGQGWKLGFNLDMSYYVSPRFRIFVDADMQFNYFDTNKRPELTDTGAFNNRILFLATQPTCGTSRNCTNLLLDTNRRLNFRFDVSINYALF